MSGAGTHRAPVGGCQLLAETQLKMPGPPGGTGHGSAAALQLQSQQRCHLSPG